MTADVLRLPAQRPRDLDPYVRDEVNALMARQRISGVRLGNITGRGQQWVSRRLRNPAAKGATPIDMESLDVFAAALGVSATSIIRAAEDARRAATDTPEESQFTGIHMDTYGSRKGPHRVVVDLFPRRRMERGVAVRAVGRPRAADRGNNASAG